MKDASFGKYRMLAELGQGGMADVILALSQGPVGFNKLVVIKRLRQHLAEDPEFVGMLVDEARLAARLNHPNIVHTHEVGEVDGRFFMAMEFLEGQPLGRLKRRARRTGSGLTLESEVRIFADVLAGLHYAHELTDYDGAQIGIVHRDVTPSNIFVTYEGVVKILDFGIAKATGRTTETRTGVVKGKTSYMPPEQALGLEVDRRADVFSVGVMLWEAATGQRMWKGMEDVVILARLINGEVPTSPREINPNVPEAIDAICRRALCPEPNGRLATALEFQNELEAYLQSSGHKATNRELGRLVTEMFAEERQEIKRILEEQIAKVKESPHSSLTPLVLPESLAMPARKRPTREASEEPIAAVSAMSHRAPPPRRRRGSILGFSLATALAGGAALWLFAQSQSTKTEAAPPPPEPGPSAAANPVESAASSDAPKPEGKMTLRAKPTSAEFSIDGGPWLDNPHVSDVKLDGAEHTIVVRAKGYEDKKTTVVFDGDVVLDVTLKRRPSAGRRPPPPSPTQPKKPPRELITGDPWKDG